METLLLCPDEQKIVLKFRRFLESKYSVNIWLPENISSCSRDIVVATVLGEEICLVKKFIRRKMNGMKRSRKQRISNQGNVTTITLSDSDSDNCVPVLKETQQKHKKRKFNKKQVKTEENNDLSSTILIEDGDESANEDSVQANGSSNTDVERTVNCYELEGETNSATKADTELFLASFIPLNGDDISENEAVDDTIILSDSPSPHFNSLLSGKEKENIPNGIDDSDIIIEEEIPGPIATKPRRLRPVVIDGSNVAREHGKVSNTFSCKGILIAINHFLQKGHPQVTAFVPQYRRHNKYGPVLTTDQPLLEELAREQHVVFTPSRRIDNKRVTCYDDRFIVELATQTGGVILSNDNFRDIAAENDDFRRTINERLLMFCFVGDIIMIPQDPLGRNGPSLENFLSFPD